MAHKCWLLPSVMLLLAVISHQNQKVLSVSETEPSFLSTTTLIGYSFIASSEIARHSPISAASMSLKLHPLPPFVPDSPVPSGVTDCLERSPSLDAYLLHDQTVKHPGIIQFLGTKQIFSGCYKEISHFITVVFALCQEVTHAKYSFVVEVTPDLTTMLRLEPRNHVVSFHKHHAGPPL
jgi:hypothetical protein